MAHFTLSDRLVNLHSKICRLQEEVEHRLIHAMPVGSLVVFQMKGCTAIRTAEVVGHYAWNSVSLEIEGDVFRIDPFSIKILSVTKRSKT